MKYFFDAKTVAVIGASSKPGKIGYEILRSLKGSGYKGKIYPIHPRSNKILDLKVYPDISAAPKGIDLAVIAIPAKQIPAVIEACGKSKVKRVVIISGGFKELGGKGAELELEATKVAKKFGIRIIGPNCIGIFNGKNRLDTFFQPRDRMVRPKFGNIAFLTQSGTYGASLLEWVAEEGLGISKFVSYGNKADVNEFDMLKYLKNDPDTKLIAIYIEGLTEGKRFLKIAREISFKKPIIVMKSGRTSGGAVAAKSHTGSLAGDDAIFTGAMAQCGIILVDDLEEMLDVIKLLSMQPLPNGNNIGIVTNGLGPCVIAIDNIERTRILKLASLGDKSIKYLRANLPPFFGIHNPIDVTGSGRAEHYKISLVTLAKDPNVHILIPFFTFQDAPIADTIEELHKVMKNIQRYDKTLLAVAAGGEFTKLQGKRFQTQMIPLIPTAKRMVEALVKVVEYSEWLEWNK
jgi:3-hydroxypropionyl-CoA synthetase (ADP-forming)